MKLGIVLIGLVLVSAATASSFSHFKRGQHGHGGGSNGGKTQGGKTQGGQTQGGATQGGQTQGGGSNGGNNVNIVALQPITKVEYKAHLEAFMDLFETAADAVDHVEGEAIKASQSGDYGAVAIEFEKMVGEYLAHLGPAIGYLGEVVERVAISDEFPPEPYCEQLATLYADGTGTYTNATRDLKFIEDMGCFEGKLRLFTTYDTSAVDSPNYTERDATWLFWETVEEAIRLGVAFHRFTGVTDEMYGDDDSSEEKRGYGMSAKKVDQLISLLEQLKLNSRR